MRRGYLIAALAFSAALCFAEPAARGAETVPAPNAVYFELLGNGFVYTLNYERMLTNHLGVRLGVGVFELELTQPGWFDLSGTYYPVAVMADYLVGDGPLRLELGAGLNAILTSNNSHFSPSGTLGVRYQPRAGGMMFRLGFTPFYIDKTIYGWGGFSVGYAFRE